MDLVGRDGELRAMRDALTATRAGRGGLVLLSGAAGMGKSALVSAFADEAARAGATVLEGGGWESGGAPAYWPWIQALRSLVRTAGISVVRPWAGAGGAAGAGAAANVEWARAAVAAMPAVLARKSRRETSGRFDMVFSGRDAGGETSGG